MLRASTLPEILKVSYQQFSSTASFSVPVEGVEKKESIGVVYPQICHFSQCLQRLGIQRGDRVALIGSGSPNWIKSDVAIQLCGGITVPLFPNLSNDIFKYEIENAECALIICLDKEGEALVLKHKNLFSHIIFNRDHSEETSIYNLERLLEEPFELESVLSYGETSLEALSENDLATIIYTSGSTGLPKGVELTHKNLCFQIQCSHKTFPLDPSTDVVLSCLPLAHIFEKMVMYFYISSGVPIHFVDHINHIAQCLKNTQPTVITLVPRLLEKVQAKMFQSVSEASLLKKCLGNWALTMASECDFLEKKPLFYPLAKKLVFKKLQKVFGGRVRFAICGGAALNKDLNIFFNNIGIHVYQGYGLTETSPVISANYPGHEKPGTVGKAFPNVDIRIDPETKEVCTRGEHTMKGYYNNVSATQNVLIDGWFHTGDCGFIDEEGYLTLNGRIKDIVKMSNGKYVSPTPIEESLNSHALIDTSMIVAEGKNFCSALIFIDSVVLTQNKQKVHSEESDENFIRSEYIKKIISDHVDFCNNRLNHWEKIKQYSIVSELVNTENGTLTPTMKIKRHIILKKYELLIKNMYTA